MLTLEQAMRYAEEAVAERGEDFVYNDKATWDGSFCSYVPKSDPRFRQIGAGREASGSAVTGCLIGEILNRAGLLSDKIAVSGLTIRSHIGVDLQVESDDVSEFLGVLQVHQDQGSTWGEALKAAKMGVSANAN